jgi:hypothetical protein
LFNGLSFWETDAFAKINERKYRADAYSL